MGKYDMKNKYRIKSNKTIEYVNIFVSDIYTYVYMILWYTISNKTGSEVYP